VRHKCGTARLCREAKRSRQGSFVSADLQGDAPADALELIAQQRRRADGAIADAKADAVTPGQVPKQVDLRLDHREVVSHRDPHVGVEGAPTLRSLRASHSTTAPPYATLKSSSRLVSQ